MDEAEALSALPGLDAVLSDISLGGGKTGLDLARLLKASKSGAQLCLMTSLPSQNPLRKEAERQFPLIKKPFSKADLGQFLEDGAAK